MSGRPDRVEAVTRNLPDRARVHDGTLDAALDGDTVLLGAAALVLGWFLLGLALYSSLFAMAGAVAWCW